MLLFASMGGIVIGSALLEKRFQSLGNLQAAKLTKSFIKFFIIGAGCYMAYAWIGAAAHLVLIR